MYQTSNKITAGINKLQIITWSKCGDRYRFRSRNLLRHDKNDNQNNICWCHQDFKKKSI